MPNYPLPLAPAPDPRWSWGLLEDLGAVLVAHGFPDPMDNRFDGMLLHRVMFVFLFGADAAGAETPP